MTEMLLQSQTSEIYILPALPDEWAEGAISGLKARGNFQISINWKNKKLIKATVLSLIGGKCRLRTNDPVIVKGTTTKSEKNVKSYTTSFDTKKGATYRIISKV